MAKVRYTVVAAEQYRGETLYAIHDRVKGERSVARFSCATYAGQLAGKLNRRKFGALTMTERFALTGEP